MSEMKYADALLAELDRFKDSKAKALVAKCGDIRAEIARVRDAAVAEAKELLSEADLGDFVASLEKAAPSAAPVENADDAADSTSSDDTAAAQAAPAPAGAPETAVPAPAPEKA